MDRIFLYIGSWGNGDKPGEGEGVTTAAFDPETGMLRMVDRLASTPDPGVLAICAERGTVYAVNEEVNIFGERGAGGGVTAMRIDPATGALRLLDTVRSLGSQPAHLSIDPSGRYVCVANCGTFNTITRYVPAAEGGYRAQVMHDTSSLALFPIREDGSLGEGTDVFEARTAGGFDEHSDSAARIGRGHPGRPLAPRAVLQASNNLHSITWLREGIALAGDRGADRIWIMRIDEESGCWQLLGVHHTHPGTAPLHVQEHRTLPVVYMTNELESTVSVYRLSVSEDGEPYALEEIQSVSCLPAGSDAANMAMELRLRPDGRFLYAVNRGHDSIAVFSVDRETGRLTQVQVFPIGEPSPRGFDISPDGRWMAVGNMDSHHVMVLRIDPADGTLTHTGSVLDVGSPTCVRFACVPGDPSWADDPGEGEDR